ncbi:MAG: N-acetyltransferase [Blastocatellia bacterium AA13]|nr:MAG: N-acetyltransferase [Blastocatellia bacterium AA13]
MKANEFTVEVRRTYLEMTDSEQLERCDSGDPTVRIERVRNCPRSFFRYLYREVGRNYHWVDRLGWSDDEVISHMSRPGFSIWVMYKEGSPAGYFELNHADDGATEIAYFGLLPEFIGRGLGKHLLTRAVDEAWATGADRVWLHTCTLDDPAAMPNYLKRGFRPYKEETYETTLTSEALADTKID